MDAGSIEPGTGSSVAPAQRGTRRSILPLVVVIGAVAVVALLVLALTSREPTTYPAGSPEASFQGYLQAWQADDLDAAYASFSDRLRQSVSRDEYRSIVDDYDWARNTDERVVLISTSVRGDEATLDLRIDTSSGGMGGGEVWSRAVSVRLVLEGGAWHIDELLVGLEPAWLEK